MENVCYKVGGHNFVIECDVEYNSAENLSDILGSFAPFITEDNGDEPIFRMHIGSKPLEINGDHICKFNHEGMGFEVFRNCSGDAPGYTFDIIFDKIGKSFRMNTSPDFHNVNVCMGSITEEYVPVLSNMLMICYAFASAPKGTLLIHSSVIVNDGKGFMFLGKSGTGKSTHSRLWLKHIEGSRLLNDDNPVISVKDGVAMVYGSPWSGKTPCYINRDALACAFVKLEQAPHNTADRLGLPQAFATLLSSTSAMRWDKDIYNSICNTITEVVQCVPFYKMECLPDEEAARVCYDKVFPKSK